MQQIKPQFEKIVPRFGTSFTVSKFEEANLNEEPFWHFHPEFEIVYIEDGSGKRHIGSHLSYYKKGDLIMIGPNLPHLGFTNRLGKSKNEIVVQMREDFLGDSILEIPEMQRIKQLFERSKTGIRFHGNTKRALGERLNDLAHMNDFERLTSFLTILQKMATSEEYSNLNAGNLAIHTHTQDNNRIKIIYKYIRENFQRPITLEEISLLINMTVPSFCRYFKKTTKKTFIEFLNEFRVVHACKLLAEEHLTISEISYDCGFNNFSHFAKHFKKVTKFTPTQYRKKLQLVVY